MNARNVDRLLPDREVPPVDRSGRPIDAALSSLQAGLETEVEMADAAVWILELRRQVEETIAALTKAAKEEDLRQIVTTVAPRYTERVRTLDETLQTQIQRLKKISERLRSANTHFLPAVRSELGDIVARLRAREVEARRVLQEAYLIDVGVGD